MDRGRAKQCTLRNRAEGAACQMRELGGAERLDERFAGQGRARSDAQQGSLAEGEAVHVARQGRRVGRTQNRGRAGQNLGRAERSAESSAGQGKVGQSRVRLGFGRNSAGLDARQGDVCRVIYSARVFFCIVLSGQVPARIISGGWGIAPGRQEEYQ